jgi:hypothetical protein
MVDARKSGMIEEGKKLFYSQGILENSGKEVKK